MQYRFAKRLCVKPHTKTADYSRAGITQPFRRSSFHLKFRHVVAYAAERYITVVPEIDIPGHSMAILAAYPNFSTTPNIPKKPATTWGIFANQNNVLAPTDEVFSFLKDVFGELMEIFPSPYIHLGGDECSKKWWKESPSCRKL